MKHFYFSFLVCLLSITSYAQCDFEVGDFEMWTDVSAQIPPGFEEGTLMLPDGILVFRYARLRDSIDYITSIAESTTLTDIEKSLALFGVAQVDDADSGDFAIRMSGNDKDRTADIAMIGKCGSTPVTANFRLKHSTTRRDSLDIFIITHRNLGFLDVGAVEFDTLAAWARVLAIADTDIPDYIDFTIDMVLNDGVEASGDSVYMEVVVDSNVEENPDGYFTVDNITFEPMTSSTGDIVQEEAVNIFPSIVDNALNYRSVENDINELYIIDSSGKIILQKKNPRSEDQIDASDWIPGHYFFQYRMDNKVRSMHFVKK